MRIETLNICGEERFCPVYDMPSKETYQKSVTDAKCPVCSKGLLRAGAGIERDCDKCGWHFVAVGNAAAPAVAKVSKRRAREFLQSASLITNVDGRWDALRLPSRYRTPKGIGLLRKAGFMVRVDLA